MSIGIDFGTTYTKFSEYGQHLPTKLLETSTSFATIMNQDYVGLEAQVRFGELKLEPGKKFFGVHRNYLVKSINYSPDSNLSNMRDIWGRFLEQTMNQALVLCKHYPEKVGVAIPAWWNRKNPQVMADWETLHKIIGRELGFSVAGIYKEPICASAFYVFKTGSMPSSLRLAVCDIGGATIDLSLCEVTEKSIKCLYTVSSAEMEHCIGGMAFDEFCINDWTHLAEISSNQFVSEMLKFETIRKDADFSIINEVETDEAFHNNDALVFDGCEIQLGSARMAYQEIKPRIVSLMEKFCEHCSGPQLKPDLVLITGGFALFPPMRKIIETNLKTNFELDESAIVNLTNDERKFAVAHGAAYIASGEFPLSIEQSSYEIGLITTQVMNGRMLRVEIPVVHVDEDIRIGAFKEILVNGNPLYLNINWDILSKSESPWYIKYQGTTNHESVFSIPNELRPGLYQVGIRINFVSQPEFIFTSRDENLSFGVLLDICLVEDKAE